MLMNKNTRRTRPIALFAVVLVALAAAVSSAAATPALQDIDDHVRQLGSNDATERAMAACHIGRMRSSEVRPAMDDLLALLSDDTVVDGQRFELALAIAIGAAVTTWATVPRRFESSRNATTVVPMPSRAGSFCAIAKIRLLAVVIASWINASI